jgi:hypothetical protein
MADENDSSPVDFMATARNRFAAAAEDERELRRKFIEDLKLASPDGDDQWDPQIKLQREMAGRPAMAFPRCHTFVQQVANEARQNKPQVKFAPRLDSDEDTAEVYEGLARFIQYESNAQIAYETAIEYSAGGSFGYYRFLTEYCDEESDDLELKIVPVMDPLTVYGIIVPTCFNRKPRFAFVVEEVPKEEYKAQYGDTEMASITWDEAGRRAEGWVGNDMVRIAEYWWCEEEKVKGKRRPKCTVKFCKINGLEVLPDSETVWPGSEIPIVPVLGKQMIIEGKPRLASVVRSQKSAQQLLNYSKTRIAETLSIAPISPFLVAEGQIDGYEKEWQGLNREIRPFLRYKPVSPAGQPLPPPQRQVQESPIQGLSAFVAQEIDDMKATTGIYDASMGAQSNETSGKAIQARAESSNLTTMHFLDNLERSFRQAGDIIEELIPKIYDSEREVTILGPDEKSKVVTINQEHEDEGGKKRNYKIAGNRVPLVVTMGRAYDTKRMETFGFMQELLRQVPQVVPILGDIMMRNSDMAGAEEAAERFHKMLPPQLQDNDNPLPPQAQAAVAQAQQQMQAMQQKLQELTFEKQAKIAEIQGKMQQIAAQSQADIALENRKMEVQIAVAEIQTKSQIAQQREQFVEDLWKEFHGNAHDAAKQAKEHAHERGMAAMEHAQELESAQQAAQLQPQMQPQVEPEPEPAQV